METEMNRIPYRCSVRDGENWFGATSKLHGPILHQQFNRAHVCSSHELRGLTFPLYIRIYTYNSSIYSEYSRHGHGLLKFNTSSTLRGREPLYHFTIIQSSATHQLGSQCLVGKYCIFIWGDSQSISASLGTPGILVRFR